MPNTVVLSGNVVAKPELHEAGATKIAKFVLANERRFGKTARTTFAPIIMFGKTAELAAQYVEKGSPITVTGNLNQENWKDSKTGANRSRISVIANEWEFNGPKPADQGDKKPDTSKSEGTPETKDDMPF